MFLAFKIEEKNNLIPIFRDLRKKNKHIIRFNHFGLFRFQIKKQMSHLSLRPKLQNSFINIIEKIILQPLQRH